MSEFNEFLAAELPELLVAADVELCPWGHSMDRLHKDYGDAVLISESLRYMTYMCHHQSHPSVFTRNNGSMLELYGQDWLTESTMHTYVRNTETGQWYLQQSIGNGDTLKREREGLRWLAELNRYNRET